MLQPRLFVSHTLSLFAPAVTYKVNLPIELADRASVLLCLQLPSISMVRLSKNSPTRPFGSRGELFFFSRLFRIAEQCSSHRMLTASCSHSNSDEAFKQVLHTAAHGKREYYINIRQAIQNKRNRSNPRIDRFWLYSLRDDRSVLMSFFENV